MMQFKKTCRTVFSFTLMAFMGLFQLHCSSGGTSSTEDVTGLQIAQQMSLVTAQSEGSTNLTSLDGDISEPTSGAYVTDETHIYTYGKSMEVMDIVNSILCYLDQTQYAEMVNQGAYIALVDETSCDKSSDKGSDSSNQSSGVTQSFNKWTVVSTRASNSSPQIVMFWLQDTDEDSDSNQTSEIRGKMTVTEGASDANPFGEFTLDFISLNTDDNSTLFEGNLTSQTTEDGQAELMLHMDSFDGEDSQLVHAILNSDGTEGIAYGNRSGDDGDQTIQVAFNSTHYLYSFESDEDTSSHCQDRTSFTNHAWSYNLYDANGAQKELNAGFSVKYLPEEGDAVWGWAGYYGIWLPDNVDVVDGLEVTNQDEDTNYTVRVADGRLIQRTKSFLTLEDLVDNVLNYWDAESNTSFQVEWDGTDLLKIGSQSCDENGCNYETLEEPVALELEPMQWLGLWKDGMGNIDIIVPESGVLSNEMEVPYYKETFVALGSDLLSGEVSFQCYFDCLKAPLTEEELSSGEAFVSSWFEIDEDSEPTLYTFDSSTYTLVNAEDEEVTYTGDSEISGPYSWGVRSGAMVLSSIELDTPWNIWDEETTYHWETGPNAWNRYTGLVDSNGDAIEFDEPMSCLYQDSEHGTFVLQYSGPGQLQGIPWEQADGDDGFDQWLPQFSIASGSTVNCDGTTYFVKQMSVEQTMDDVDESECSGLALGSVEAPTNEYTDNEMDSAPEVTDAPAVIGGVLQ